MPHRRMPCRPCRAALQHLLGVYRFFAASDSDDGGPPPVRDADHIYGLPDVHASHAPELARANLVTRRTIALLTAAYDAGA